MFMEEEVQRRGYIQNKRCKRKKKTNGRIAELTWMGRQEKGQGKERDRAKQSESIQRSKKIGGERKNKSCAKGDEVTVFFCCDAGAKGRKSAKAMKPKEDRCGGKGWG